MVDTMRMRQICLTGLISLVQIVCTFATERPTTPPAPEPWRAKSADELRTRVDELLTTGDPVMIRRNIADVLTLVARLVQSEQSEAALAYLSAALTYDSWALDYQLLLAEMLVTRGQSAAARQRAELVLCYAEKDRQINRARKLLQQDPCPALPRMARVDAEGTTLVLIPVGDVDVCVLGELQQVLRARLAIPVLLQDAQVPVPPSKRDPVARYVAELRGRLQNALKADERLVTFLQQKGIRPADLQQDAEVVKACRQIALTAGEDEVTRFDAAMDRLKKTGRQWDISDLLANLTAAVRPFRQTNVYFLGVADLDAFVDQSNFIFGTAETGGHHAVITYRRFTADFNEETPNRKRLVDRMLKQALSSIGFMLGVPRCSMPTCARAYPHSLSEHDAKTTDLCDACRLGFERALGVKLQKDRQDPPSSEVRR